MKRTIDLRKRVKRQMTRPQMVVRNLLVIAVFLSLILSSRAGHFTAVQAYQSQLLDLGITQKSLEDGQVRLVSDIALEEEDLDTMMVNRHYDFDPVRVVTLESTVGGETAHLRIVIGQRAFLWYGTACEIYYPEYQTWQQAISY